ncbi:MULTISPECIES: DUF1702 family protein [unclassified Nocardia]|uniref:DUF1702 family protein n=1 Tax=Nocardia sp. JCM 34519.1 TaxID=2876119 RepID=UPI001CE3CC55
MSNEEEGPNTVGSQVRGFPARNPHASARPEIAGATSIGGSGVGAERGVSAETAPRLFEIESERRRFAFEGAAPGEMIMAGG